MKYQILDSEGVNLNELKELIFDNIKFLMLTFFLGAVIGVVIAFGITVEYKTSLRFFPDGNKSNELPGGLGGLADLAGINLGSNSNNNFELQLIPDIVNSHFFNEKLVASPISFSSLEYQVSSKKYFDDFHSDRYFSKLLLLPGRLVDLIKKEDEKPSDTTTIFIDDINSYAISADHFFFIEGFKERINISIDEVTGIITVTAKMPDPIASASLVRNTYSLIVDELISINNAKAKLEHFNIQMLYDSAKTHYDYSLQKLAMFNSKNRILSSEYSKIEQMRLENEVDVKYQLFKQASLQLENAKIQLIQNTPSFIQMDEVIVPIEKDTPQRKIVLVLTVLLSLVIGFTVIIVRNFIA